MFIVIILARDGLKIGYIDFRGENDQNSVRLNYPSELIWNLYLILTNHTVHCFLLKSVPCQYGGILMICILRVEF